MRNELVALGLAVSIASSAGAGAPKRIGPDASPISASVSVPPGGRLVYISGTVPDAVDAKAPEGSVARFGDTEAQNCGRRLGLGNSTSDGSGTGEDLENAGNSERSQPQTEMGAGIAASPHLRRA